MQEKVSVKDKLFVPASQVFEAIVNPEHISGYFATSASSELTAGAYVTLNFDDVGAKLDIHVLHVEKNRLVTFEWKATGKPTCVDILLVEVNDKQTNIEITEAPFDLEEEEFDVTMRQTQGWTDFVCSLKAYLYTGINLRNGKLNEKKAIL